MRDPEIKKYIRLKDGTLSTTAGNTLELKAVGLSPAPLCLNNCCGCYLHQGSYVFICLSVWSEGIVSTFLHCPYSDWGVGSTAMSQHRTLNYLDTDLIRSRFQI